MAENLIDRFYRARDARTAWPDEVARRAQGLDLKISPDFFFHMNPLYEPNSAMQLRAGVIERNSVPLLLGNDWRSATGSTFHFLPDNSVWLTDRSGTQTLPLDSVPHSVFPRSCDYFESQGFPSDGFRNIPPSILTLSDRLHYDLQMPELIDSFTIFQICSDVPHPLPYRRFDSSILQVSDRNIPPDSLLNSFPYTYGLDAMFPSDLLIFPDNYTSGNLEIDSLIRKHKELFVFSSSEPIGSCVGLEHRIDLTSDIPIFKPVYRLPQKHRDFWAKLNAELLQRDLIEVSDSPYGAPAMVVSQHLHVTTPERGDRQPYVTQLR